MKRYMPSFWLRAGFARTFTAATTLFLVTMSIAAVAVNRAPPAWRAHSVAALRAVAIGQPLVVEAETVPAKARCTVCGVVESVLQVEGEPRGVYEFRVRMRDGSLRKSFVTDPGRWRPGDAIMLIGPREPAPCVRQRTDGQASSAHRPPVDAVIRPEGPSPGCSTLPLESP